MRYRKEVRMDKLENNKLKDKQTKIVRKKEGKKKGKEEMKGRKA